MPVDLVADKAWLREAAEVAAADERATMMVDPVVVLDLLDALEAAQRPPVGRIEQALEGVWDAGNASGLDGWVGPGRGAGEVDDQAIYNRNRDVRTAMEKLGQEPRPPLGYVVVGIREAEGESTSLCRGFHGSISSAIESVGRSDTPRGVRYAVAEVREVLDHG